ncbi:MAG: hypothetical protein DRR06_20740 [Gammaproteobacteria bacterium]|nr:MAG: hypothetical protein DRR06_20740 [Gammaproteobacteria bacterium]
MRITGVVAVLAAGVAIAASSMTSGICVDVVDGDTVIVEIEGQREMIQLAEIDAPEPDQAFGEQARQFLSELVINKPVELVFTGTGPAGRIAHIRVGTTPVNQEMLAAGMAWTRKTENEALILAGMMARGDRKGLWQDDKPIPPETWRNRRPVEPTPVPVEISRSLADAGRKLELRKNADGKAIIAGLPMIDLSKDEEGETEAEEKPKDLKYEFLCAKEGTADCVRQKFVSKFSEAYEGDGPGTYASNPVTQGEGQLTAVFQGTSAMGRAYTVGAACSCNDDSCQCVMQFGKLQTTEDTSS